jgi:glutamate transport system substrate-binding protein
MRAARLGAVILVALVAVVVVVTTVLHAVPPSRDDLLHQAGLVGKGELRIGTKFDQPGISLVDPRTGEYFGFDIDIAYMIAADLGFPRSAVKFLPIEAKDRARMQALENNHFVTVDLVIASYSITAERASLPGVLFSAPYLRTTQSVLTRRDHPSVQSLTDLAGQHVCSLTTSTSVIATQQAGLSVTQMNKISDCVDGLLSRKFDAVTTDAAILAGFAHLYPDKLKMHAIGLDADERWGINCGSNRALLDLVNLSLYHSRYDPNDHRWEDAFDRNLRSEQADALPQEVAIDEQPPVPKVRVREWPWQGQ